MNENRNEGPCHCTALRRITQLYDVALGPSGLQESPSARLVPSTAAASIDRGQLRRR